MVAAYYDITACKSLCIEKIVHGAEDYVIFYIQDTLSDERTKRCKSKIRYTKRDDRAYFMCRGTRIYLDNCMRTK